MAHLALVFILLLVVGCGRSDEIDYRGQRVKLSRSYSDYDEYKNDPNNIHPSERARVQTLVKTAPVDSSYRDTMTLYKSLSSMSFPGYGAGNLARTRQQDGSELLAYGIEIPGTEEDRCFLFRTSGSAYVLLDDFVASGVFKVKSVHDEGREWVYRSANRDVVFRRAKSKG